VEIVTGAPIPEGADAVVMVEDTERENGELRIFSTITTNENIMKKGSDIKKGQIVLKKGQVLGSSEIGVLAALGLVSAKVLKIPIVAVLSTGGEVNELGKKLPPGKIYDINAYSISTAVIESGGKPVYLGVVPDDKKALSKTMQTALASADMIITSGGVSVGPKDYTPQIVDALGKPGVVVYGIAVKPGKPTTVGLLASCFPASHLHLHCWYTPSCQPMVCSAGRPGWLKSVKAAAGSRYLAQRQTNICHG
jgi:putative molybdopterin biosynthesis protein